MNTSKDMEALEAVERETAAILKRLALLDTIPKRQAARCLLQLAALEQDGLVTSAGTLS